MWSQVYNSLQNIVLSALLAFVPVVVLLGALGFFHLKAHVAALLGLAASLAISVFEFGMPVQMSVMSAVYGAAYGLLPIATIFRFQPEEGTQITRIDTAKAWLPWVILSIAVFLWGIPQFKAFLDGLFNPKLSVPGLDKLILRVPPLVPAPRPEAAVYALSLLSATGTGILVAAIAGGFLMGYSPAGLARVYWQTIKLVRLSLLTIACMLALGYVTRYSGTDATLGLAFAQTGAFYPMFGTLLGWLGVALTGSDTSSNVLFGGLQKITAQQLGLNPVLMAAANSSGGVMGKMIDAQSIVVASTATRSYGHEGEILRFVFFHSLSLAVLVGILVTIQAHL